MHGSRAVYFHITKAMCIEGMTSEASKSYMNDLLERMIQPQVVYHHEWRKGDVLVIDDRATMHRAHGDYDRSRESRAVAHHRRRRPTDAYLTVARGSAAGMEIAPPRSEANVRTPPPLPTAAPPNDSTTGMSAGSIGAMRGLRASACSMKGASSACFCARARRRAP